MIVRDDAGRKADRAQLLKKSHRFFIRRSAVLYQRVVDIQDQRPVPFLI